MKIEDHLQHTDSGPVEFVESPNLGGALDARYLIMHYTAGRNAASSIHWLADPAARASAHLVIAIDGSITQLIPFDRVAWHAGVSNWDGLRGLNAHSIGIELDNAGRLEQKGNRWCAWFGDAYPDEEVMVATHRLEDRPCGWQLFSSAQLDATLEASRAIVQAYGLVDVLGHDDISPGRKADPGPAFPMESFRAATLGRSEDELPRFLTTTALNIREGAGARFTPLPAAPLPRGTELEVVSAKGSWRLVNVVGEVGGDRDVQGWVHGGFIERVG